jgi:hypothetical protein
MNQVHFFLLPNNALLIAPRKTSSKFNSARSFLAGNAGSSFYDDAAARTSLEQPVEGGGKRENLFFVEECAAI